MQIRNHFFKKEFGQNFLRNKKVVSKLVSILNISPLDLVVEIGPGDGFITEEILNQTTNYLGIEVDSDLIPVLKDKFTKAKFINEDFLKVNLQGYLNENEYDQEMNIKFIGNLPFNNSKDIISTVFHLTKKLNIELATFVVQEEVSQSYVSKIPNMTPIGAIANIYAEPKKFETIARKYFEPSPKVAGGIISFPIKENIPDSAIEIEKLIKVGFSSPRKTLINNIKNSNRYNNVDDAFKSIGLSLNSRAAEISSDTWIMLNNNLILSSYSL
ncbi:hypothetical protein KC669_02080 [Candidatus Dojkabacteria bacterium]|uniref:Ribosomal RNA adenine methylase transferase N-terminal domain-containing protein n=1 Tax=Candidatus Dojkabacteria bacterium TaxID=2099670 RepID=A0A955RL87_9BACT|nr:hypothetical protein [Candidatus Dojkabacteria bacterium]